MIDFWCVDINGARFRHYSNVLLYLTCTFSSVGKVLRTICVRLCAPARLGCDLPQRVSEQLLGTANGIGATINAVKKEASRRSRKYTSL